MKLTDRDQKLLRFLAVFLLAVGFTYFILLPGIEKSEDLSQKISDRELQKSEMDMKLALLPQMQKTNEEMIQRREEAAGLFLPRMSSQRIDRMLLEMLQACGLEAMNMNISISEEAFTLEPFPGSVLAQEQAVSGGSAGGTETTDGTNASQETKFSAEQLRSAKVDQMCIRDRPLTDAGFWRNRSATCWRRIRSEKNGWWRAAGRKKIERRCAILPCVP